MNKVLNLIFVTLMCFNTLACANSGVMDMNSAENKWNRSASSRLVAYMSLDEMFHDSQVKALAKAAGNGDLKKIDELILQDVDVNARGNLGATPLFWAMINFNGFKRLLEIGADANVVYDDGGSIMHWVVGLKDRRFLKTALKYNGDPNLVSGDSFKNTPIFDAIKAGSDTIDILLNAGADIDFQDDFGYTPVMSAASLNFDIVYYLLEKGANYRIKNKSGEDLASRIASKIGAFKRGSKSEKWMNKVIEWLEIRGVHVSR